MEVPVPLAVAWSVIPRQVEIEFISEYLFWTEEIAYEKYHLDGTLSVSIDMIIIWVATAVLLEGAKRATCDFARSAILVQCWSEARKMMIEVANRFLSLPE